MKKKLTAVALVVCMLAIMLVGASLAYFTDKDEAENVFTVGNIDIVLTEPQWVEVGSKEALEAYPGEALAKDPTVTNEGANPCLVRVKVEWPTDPAVVGDWNYRNENYVIDAVNEGWYAAEDGYIYYLKPLATDEITAKPAFSAVVVPTSLTNDFSGTEYKIPVYAEAVQAQGVFASYSKLADGIDTETVDAATGKTELQVVQEFFTTAFAAN